MKTLNNLPQILSSKIEKNPDKIGFFSKEKGEYVGYSYQSVFNRSCQLSSFLQQKGIQLGDKVSLWSNNCLEWVIADMGILMSGAVVVPLYSTINQSSAEYIIDHSESKVLIIESLSIINSIEDIKKACPKIEHIIVLSKSSDGESISFAEITADEPIEFTPPDIDRSAISTIVYTSGTTGVPKGVVLTHGNILSNLEDGLAVIPISDSDRVLSFLPLSHMFERSAGYYAMLAQGAEIWYAESVDTVAADLLVVQPTILISVPRLYEKIYAKILLKFSGPKRGLLNWALSLSEAVKSGNASLGGRLLFSIVDRVLFKAIRKKTGGQLRFFVSGGSALNPEIARFFYLIGLLILEGYGLTETSPILTCNRLEKFKLGSVGLPFDQVALKIEKDGELLAKGPNIMSGYWKNQDATDEVLSKDGWFSTGDLARIDDDGFVFINGRKKEIIVSSNGKNISPVRVETEILKSDYVSQVAVFGDDRPFLVAIIVLDLAFIKEKYPDFNGDISPSSELISDAWADISKKQQELSTFETIKKVVWSKDEWTVDNNCLTPTMKVRRRQIFTQNEEAVNALWESK